jgi:hypothetical protein
MTLLLLLLLLLLLGGLLSSYERGPSGKGRLEVEFLLALHFAWLPWARQARQWTVLGRKGGRWLW